MSRNRAAVYICFALLLLAGCRGESEGSGYRLEISYGGGYSSVDHGVYTLTPVPGEDTVRLWHTEVDSHGGSKGYRRTISLDDLEGLYRVFEASDIWKLPSSDLRTATDQHTYTATVKAGGREHTFSVYGPRLHPDERYWNIIGAVLALGGDEAVVDIPDEFRLNVMSEGGLSVLEYEEHTVVLVADRSHLIIEEKERSGGVKTHEWEGNRAAAVELYLAVMENDFWELFDSRAAEKIVTDIPTYTFTLEVGDRSHSFSVYAPIFDPDSRYGEIVRAVYGFAAEAEPDLIYH